MTIVSLPFFLFVGATALIYFIVPKRFRWTVLLVASYLFYWFNSKTLTLVLFGVTAATYLVGLWIQSVSDRYHALLKNDEAPLSPEDKKEIKERRKKVARGILTLGVLVDLLTLLFFKYFNFFGENLNALFSLDIPRISLLLPVGISFYTLQALSYMTDVYRGKTRADRNPFKFMLFMSFFPQIIQGPIPRHSHLARQLYEGHPFDYTRLCHGVQLMVWGFIKKLIIAERLAKPVGMLLAADSGYTGPILFFGSVLYGLQVYTDFSGGMDIARGVAQIVGVDLEMNFSQPYFSVSIEDFWRRWHITMGHWMRDYVFYPLSLSKGFTVLGRKSRKILGKYTGKRLPSLLAMFIVYLLVGFWHGANWKYVAFGLWNGLFIMSGILFESVFRIMREKLKVRENSFSWKAFRVARTLVIVSFGRFFSGAADLPAAFGLFRRTFTNWRDITFLTNGTLNNLGLNTANWILLLFAVTLLFAVDAIHERGISIRERIDRQSIPFRWAIYIAAVLAILVFGIYGPAYDAAGFIYQQF